MERSSSTANLNSQAATRERLRLAQRQRAYRIFIGAAAASDAMSASDSEASFASFAMCHLPRLRSVATALSAPRVPHFNVWQKLGVRASPEKESMSTEVWPSEWRCQLTQSRMRLFFGLVAERSYFVLQNKVAINLDCQVIFFLLSKKTNHLSRQN